MPSRREVLGLLRQLERSAGVVDEAKAALTSVTAKGQAAGVAIAEAQRAVDSAVRDYDSLFAQVKTAIASTV